MTDAEHVLRELWSRIDAQDWDGLGALLAPGLRAGFVHSGETFDRPGFVEFQRSYPGHWRATVHDLVGAGDRAVSRVSVHDPAAEGVRTFHVATFVHVTDGLVDELTEVWTDEGEPPPRTG